VSFVIDYYLGLRSFEREINWWWQLKRGGT
jgi:hypothetical protein